MNSFLKRTVLCLILLLEVGCAKRINTTMNSWVGIHESVLLQKWGPPSQIVGDGQGGKIFLYVAQREWTTPDTRRQTTTINGQVDGNGNINGTATTTTTGSAPTVDGYAATRMFFINSKGYVYSWRWKGY
jgi:hypothetical protein